MNPRPQAERPEHKGTGKLQDKVAFITGGDSGIGRAVAILFAKEGAHVAISYLLEHKDAEETRKQVEQEGRECLLLPGDIGYERNCEQMIQQTVDRFGRLDIVVNNAAEQHPQDDIAKISSEQLERTFRTNIFSYFFVAKAALKHDRRWQRERLLWQTGLRRRAQIPLWPPVINAAFFLQLARAFVFGALGLRPRIHLATLGLGAPSVAALGLSGLGAFFLCHTLDLLDSLCQ